MRWCFCSWVVSILLISAVQADEKILGASKALELIQAPVDKSADPPPGDTKILTLEEFQAKLADLDKNLKSLKPEEHAQRWLGLSEAAALLIANEQRYNQNRLPQNLLKVVSPPETWPKLIETLRAKPLPDQIDKRRGVLALHWIAATLANDNTELEKLRKTFAEFNKNRSTSFPDFDRFGGGMRSMSHDREEPADKLKALEEALADKNLISHSVTVPDLISLLGLEKATPLIDKILKSKEITKIQVESAATKKLFKERILALDTDVAKPHWELIEDPEDLPLYELFTKLSEKKQNDKKTEPGEAKNAESKHIADGDLPTSAENLLLIKLLDEDRQDDVKKILRRRAKNTDNDRFHSRFETVKDFFNAEQGAKLLEIYEETFADDWTSLPWDQYFAQAAKQKDQQPVKRLVEEALADKNLNHEKKDELLTQYVDHLLNLDLTADAVRTLRQHSIEADGSGLRGYNGNKPLASALKIYLLGTLLDRPEWAKQGLELAEKIYQERLDAKDFEALNYTYSSFIEALLAEKRYADAERLAIAALKAIQNAPGRQSERLAQEALATLCVVYDELHRRDDVLKLFDQAPWWEAQDLGSVIRIEFADRSLGVIAARAMADAKKPDQALKILDVVLEQRSGLDDAYELLIGIDPAGSMQKLTALAKRDPYQERPLIWQAKLLLANGDVPRAGQVIREAITIDPSDGEQGKNSRMLAYKVLAEVLRKEGDDEAAKIFDGAIAAIRKSERADDYRRAGLHAIARKMYKESLGLFNDAYCIQSRLAIELYQNGDLEQAAIHFERAFQLMPNSFGMIESHCFGCEGAFAGELAQSLAEKIFLRLLVEDPKKPQVHYLLGYLRSAQDRRSEALKHYKEAVRLAPRYLNAWEKLADIAEGKPEHAALYSEAKLALLKIDPFQQHSRVDTRDIHDLQSLWQVLADAAKERRPPATYRYELAGAKKYQQRELESPLKLPPGLGSSRLSPQYMPSLRESEMVQPESRDYYPGEAISENRRFEELENFLTN